uniref:Uncharacterized protein n=1 Tax=Opuntia streptacantha TaxID=393608 RepID=A0A7C9DH11_OPUST
MTTIPPLFSFSNLPKKNLDKHLPPISIDLLRPVCDDVGAMIPMTPSPLSLLPLPLLLWHYRKELAQTVNEEARSGLVINAIFPMGIPRRNPIGISFGKKCNGIRNPM